MGIVTTLAWTEITVMMMMMMIMMVVFWIMSPCRFVSRCLHTVSIFRTVVSPCSLIEYHLLSPRGLFACRVFLEGEKPPWLGSLLCKNLNIDPIVGTRDWATAESNVMAGIHCCTTVGNEIIVGTHLRTLLLCSDLGLQSTTMAYVI
jgi:hypothetical protein